VSAHASPGAVAALEAATVDELRDARRLAHRLILAKPDAVGCLLFKVFCRDIGAELTHRGELAPDCPYCLADLEAAAGKPAVSAALHHERGALPAQLVEATP
jgi:hypothetical protein